MPFGQESEKRMGTPTPAQASKCQTTSAADTLSGQEMWRLPHSLRQEIPAGAKIETLELKSKLPKQVEDEATGLLWNSVRKFYENKNPTKLSFHVHFLMSHNFKIQIARTGHRRFSLADSGGTKHTMQGMDALNAPPWSNDNTNH